MSVEIPCIWKIPNGADRRGAAPTLLRLELRLARSEPINLPGDLAPGSR